MPVLPSGPSCCGSVSLFSLWCGSRSALSLFTYHFHADPDLAPLKRDDYLHGYIFSLQAFNMRVQALHCFLSSLHSAWILSLMQIRFRILFWLRCGSETLRGSPEKLKKMPSTFFYNCVMCYRRPIPESDCRALSSEISSRNLFRRIESVLILMVLRAPACREYRHPWGILIWPPNHFIPQLHYIGAWYGWKQRVFNVLEGTRLSRRRLVWLLPPPLPAAVTFLSFSVFLCVARPAYLRERWEGLG